LPYLQVCRKTGGGQVRAHCRQLLFRALSGSAVECDDWAHLDGRGDLNSGAPRQAYSITLSCHIVQNLVGLAACLVGPPLEEVCVHSGLEHRPRNVLIGSCVRLDLNGEDLASAGHR
jgi:hypothetical protein